MKVLVIPDVHLKPWMFAKATKAMKKYEVEQAVCLMDIPDDWGQEDNLGLYEETFDEAVKFQLLFPDTLWCWGNHELAYVWDQNNSGFSSKAIPVVIEKLDALKRVLPDVRQMAYIHKIDNVLFLHGGLKEAFVERYCPDVYDDTDAVVAAINRMGPEEMWREISPIWFRPQLGYEKEMYKYDELLQVVGHTPVIELQREENVLSCDVFSTRPNGEVMSTEEFLLIDTGTWEYSGISSR